MWSRLCGRHRPAAQKELSHLLFGARAFNSRRPAATHELRVWTGDARGAATRAEVFVKLFGYSGEEVHVPLSSGTFDRDSLDVFEIEVPAAVSVGGIKRIEIGHDDDALTAPAKGVNARHRPQRCLDCTFREGKQSV